MNAVFKDDTALFKQFVDTESFRGWLTSKMFELTYNGPRTGPDNTRPAARRP